MVQGALSVLAAFIPASGIQLQVPPVSWTRIWHCEGKYSKNRQDFSIGDVTVMAARASMVKICTAGNPADCIQSRPGSFPILMMRKGFLITQNNGYACDYNCAAATWDGPRSPSQIANWCGPIGPGMGGQPIWSCNNGNGIHMGIVDNGMCGWTSSGSDNLEVFIDASPPSVTCSSGGDPHTLMFAGTHHNFQGVGEYVFAASSSAACGSFAVHTCDQPLPPPFPYVGRTAHQMVAVRSNNCTILCQYGNGCRNISMCSAASGVSWTAGSIALASGVVVSVQPYTFLGMWAITVSVSIPLKSSGGFCANMSGLCGAYTPSIGFKDAFINSHGYSFPYPGFDGYQNDPMYATFAAQFANTWHPSSGNALFSGSYACPYDPNPPSPPPPVCPPGFQQQARVACAQVQCAFDECVSDAMSTCLITPWIEPLQAMCNKTSANPTPAPTLAPTPAPTFPTSSPTRSPTANPTKTPTVIPTPAPTPSPTVKPTPAPTRSPTVYATTSPTHSPTVGPTSPFPPKPVPNCTQGPITDPCFGMTLPKPTKGDGFCPQILPPEVGRQPDWGLGMDISNFSNWIKCTASVTTSYGTCMDYCLGQGKVCIMGYDNDHHDLQGLGSSCVVSPPNDTRTAHNQTIAGRGCYQCWKTQLCQCGAPPLCSR